VIKVKTDISNTEASSRLDKIYSLLNDIDSARHFMDSGDFSTAINLFSEILEVIIQ
jgi:hypothetical protein